MARRSKASAASPPASPPDLPPVPPVAIPLALPAELTIYTVGELHPQWLAWLGQGAAAVPAEVPAEVQAAAVEQVDAAGLQLLLSLQRALAERGRQLQIQAPSEVLRNGCAALGLGLWLQTQMTEGALV
jgi:ABC-type transporter Mla MlaB component